MNKIKGVIFDLRGTLANRDHNLVDFFKTVLTELKNRGYKLGLITTSKNTEERKQIIAQSGLQSFFDVTMINSTKVIEHFRQCIDQIGTLPETTCIVDDRTVRGVQSGNALSCMTIWIRNGKYIDELPTQITGQPTHTIPTIQDLLMIL